MRLSSRRFPRFRLSTILLVVVIIGLSIGWWRDRQTLKRYYVLQVDEWEARVASDREIQLIEQDIELFEFMLIARAKKVGLRPTEQSENVRLESERLHAKLLDLKERLRARKEELRQEVIEPYRLSNREVFVLRTQSP